MLVNGRALRCFTITLHNDGGRFFNNPYRPNWVAKPGYQPVAFAPYNKEIFTLATGKLRPSASIHPGDHCPMKHYYQQGTQVTDWMWACGCYIPPKSLTFPTDDFSHIQDTRDRRWRVPKSWIPQHHPRKKVVKHSRLTDRKGYRPGDNRYYKKHKPN